MQEGSEYLNTIRQHAGLIKLKRNTSLQHAAVSHASYIIQNQSNGHYEEKGKYVYMGSTPSDRVKKAGYPSAFVMENLSVNTEGEVKSIDNLFSAIYHRFVFLNLDKDEIGFGLASTQINKQMKRAYVYDMGSSRVSKLCKQSFTMTNGVYYMKDICSQGSKMVPQSLFIEKQDEVRRENRGVILYPYDKQNNIWPAFYNESPDPLPGYKVSGFPVSVQLNPAYYKSVKLQSFRLYDESGKEPIQAKILQHNNDQNHLLTELEFALMPLKRLEFDTKYAAVFEALADGSQMKRSWSFRTAKPQENIYRITKDKTKLKVVLGSTVVLYMVPDSREDIVHSYRSSGGIKVSFLDQNTLRVTFPNKHYLGRAGLDFGRKKVSFDVQ